MSFHACEHWAEVHAELSSVSAHLGLSTFDKCKQTDLQTQETRSRPSSLRQSFLNWFISSVLPGAASCICHANWKTVLMGPWVNFDATECNLLGGGFSPPSAPTRINHWTIFMETCPSFWLSQVDVPSDHGVFVTSILSSKTVQLILPSCCFASQRPRGMKAIPQISSEPVKWIRTDQTMHSTRLTNAFNKVRIANDTNTSSRAAK